MKLLLRLAVAVALLCLLAVSASAAEKITVVLDPGHGGSDPGAAANGVQEKNLNLSIALACQSELARHGVSVLMSRTTDENDTLTEEKEMTSKVLA